MFLGDTSYALYLSHRFVLRAATVLLLPLLPPTPLGAWVYVSMTCVIALCVGILSHLLLERPFRRLCCKFFWLRAFCASLLR